MSDLEFAATVAVIAVAAGLLVLLLLAMTAHRLDRPRRRVSALLAVRPAQGSSALDADDGELSVKFSEEQPPEPSQEGLVEVACDPAFRRMVEEEAFRVCQALPRTVLRGLMRKYPSLGVIAADEPDASLHGGNTEVFGDFVEDGHGWAQLGVYRGPIERATPHTGITTREHVHRVILHELGHAAGMRHGDFPPGI